MLEGSEEYDELLEEAEKVVSEYKEKVDEYAEPFIEARKNLGVKLNEIPEPAYEREEMAKRTAGIVRYISDIEEKLRFNEDRNTYSSMEKSLGELIKDIEEEPSIDQIKRFGELKDKCNEAKEKLAQSELKLYSRLEKRGIIEEGDDFPAVAKVREEIDPYYRKKMQEIEKMIQEKE